MRSDFFSLATSDFDPSLADKPLMLLDIDGVLNAYRYRPAESVLPVGGYEDLTEFDVYVDEDRSYRFWTSPTLISELKEIASSGLVEVAWLTTWENRANLKVCPVLGLPVFPVAAGQYGRFSDYYWKPRAAVEAIELGRPIVWVDDVEIRSTEREAFAESGLPHLLIAPDPEFGLTRGDMSSIRDFIGL